MKNFFRMIAAVAALFVTASAAQAQAIDGAGVSFSGGTMNYDLSGVGNTPALALRADFPVSPIFRVEAGVVRPSPTSSSATTPPSSSPRYSCRRSFRWAAWRRTWARAWG